MQSSSQKSVIMNEPFQHGGSDRLNVRPNGFDTLWPRIQNTVSPLLEPPLQILYIARMVEPPTVHTVNDRAQPKSPLRL